MAKVLSNKIPLNSVFADEELFPFEHRQSVFRAKTWFIHNDKMLRNLFVFCGLSVYTSGSQKGRVASLVYCILALLCIVLFQLLIFLVLFTDLVNDKPLYLYTGVSLWGILVLCSFVISHRRFKVLFEAIEGSESPSYSKVDGEVSTGSGKVLFRKRMMEIFYGEYGWLAKKRSRQYGYVSVVVVLINLLIVVMAYFTADSSFADSKSNFFESTIPPFGERWGWKVAFIFMNMFNGCAWTFPVALFATYSNILCWLFKSVHNSLKNREKTLRQCLVRHRELTLLTAQCSNVFQPLVVVSFVLNIPIIVVFLYATVLGGDNSKTGLLFFSQIFWLFCGFAHIGAISVFASDVHATAVGLVEDLYDRGDEAMCTQNDTRMEVSSNEIVLFLHKIRDFPPGFSFLGSGVVVTRRVVISLLSIIVSYFIILRQLQKQ